MIKTKADCKTVKTNMNYSPICDTEFKSKEFAQIKKKSWRDYTVLPICTSFQDLSSSDGSVEI